MTPLPPAETLARNNIKEGTRPDIPTHSSSDAISSASRSNMGIRAERFLPDHVNNVPFASAYVVDHTNNQRGDVSTANYMQAQALRQYLSSQSANSVNPFELSQQIPEARTTTLELLLRRNHMPFAQANSSTPATAATTSSSDDATIELLRRFYNVGNGGGAFY